MSIAIAHIYDSKGNERKGSNYAKGEQISVDVVSTDVLGWPYYTHPVSLVIQDTEKHSFSPISAPGIVNIWGHASLDVTMPNVDAGATMTVFDDREHIDINISIGSGFAPETEPPTPPETIGEAIGDVTSTAKNIIIVLLVVAAIGLVLWAVSKYKITIPKLGGIK